MNSFSHAPLERFQTRSEPGNGAAPTLFLIGLSSCIAATKASSHEKLNNVCPPPKELISSPKPKLIPPGGTYLVASTQSVNASTKPGPLISGSIDSRSKKYPPGTLGFLAYATERLKNAANIKSSFFITSAEPYSNSPSLSQSQPLKKVAISPYSFHVCGTRNSFPVSALYFAWYSGLSITSFLYFR